MHMKIDANCCDGVNGNVIQYLYKLGKGISSVKGGIKVLQDLDYPIEIINDTKRIINIDVEI